MALTETVEYTLMSVENSMFRTSYVQPVQNKMIVFFIFSKPGLTDLKEN